MNKSFMLWRLALSLLLLLVFAIGCGDPNGHISAGGLTVDDPSGSSSSRDEDRDQNREEDKAFESDRRWAILIGVDDYAEAKDLEYCGADEKALRARLVRRLSQRQMFLLHDDEDKKYLPIRRNIERELELVLNLVEKDDFLVVGFSGHGVHMDKTSYLSPTDAVLDKPDSLISLDWLYERLNKCPAALKLVLIDACRNDPRVGGIADQPKSRPIPDSSWDRSTGGPPRAS